MDRYNVFLSQPAELDLTEIFYHISAKLLAPQTAEHMIDTFHKEMQTLEVMPKRNPLVNDVFLANLGYRILPVKNYLVFYSVYDLPTKEVNIERILYSKRNWQSILNPAGDI